MDTELARILLVEDDPHDEELLLAALAESGLANAVVVTRDGQQALDYLRREGSYSQRPGGNPVFVVLDLKLLKIDGLEVLRQIRADPELQAIPVVILSSSHEERDIARGYDLGVNGYVVKPLEFQQFFESVKGLGWFWAIINQPPLGSVGKGV